MTGFPLVRSHELDDLGAAPAAPPGHPMDLAQTAVLRAWADVDEMEPLAIPEVTDDRQPPWRFTRAIDDVEAIDLATPVPPPSRGPLTLHLVVLVGLTGRTSLQARVRRQLAVDPDREPPPVRNADCFSAAIAVEPATGRPIASSLVVSRLVLLSRRLGAGSVDLAAGLRVLSSDVDAEARWLGRAMDDIDDTTILWPAVLRRWQTIAAPIGGSRRGPVGIVIGEWTKPDQDPEAVALESFFAPALRQLARGGVLNDTLARYLSAPPGTQHETAVDVGTLEQIATLLVPGAGPAGRWPSRSGDLTTTQRLAVSRMSERLGPGTSDLLAINGPPGTGKSTLLREFVADQIVRRAAAIVALGPDAALPLTTMRGRRMFGLHPQVAGFEMIVAAENNRAVENVAKMLNELAAVPADMVRTHLTGAGDASDGDWWALVALVLGRRRNIRAAMRVLAPRPPANPWPGWLGGLPSWSDARDAFDHASSRVDRLTSDGVRRAETWRALRRQFPALTGVRGGAEMLDHLRREEARYAARVEAHRATRPGWFARQFARPGWTAWVAEHERACAARDELARLDAALTLDEQRGSAPVLDAEGWLAMPDRVARERHPPGVDRALEEARADRFVAALHVHGAALATRADAVGTMFGTWAWSLDSPGTFTSAERRVLWRSAFVVIPVMTTTLASAGRMLDAFGFDGLGTAVVDEAGQACAHHAVPLFAKVRRAVVVGDQQQLAPVVTLEAELLEPVMAAAGADERFSPHVASVQRLADAGSREGTRIELGESSTWVGLPLRGHFRCADPMFGIANTISYGGTMIRLRAAEPIGDVASGLSTTWIDVPLAAGSHWGPDDRTALTDVLTRVAEPPDDELFIIAPFRVVVDGARRVASGLDRSRRTAGPRHDVWRAWGVEHIGTVHTFQGREADTVVLLLSADADRPRARSWVARPPNLLNVAVTRARERLIVIGNHAAWSAEPGGGELAARIAPRPSRPQWPPPTARAASGGGARDAPPRDGAL